MAVGTVIVTTGVLPGGDDGNTVGAGSDVRTEMRTEVPSRLRAQGDASASPTMSPSRTAGPTKSPSEAASPKPSDTSNPSKKSSRPSATPSKQTRKATDPARKPASEPARERTRAPEPTATRSKTAAPDTSAAASAEAAVIDMVNNERVKVGCSPLKASGALSDLARAHSKDMAARGFFDHTNPDGETPWDRAERAGVSNLGGENIARGQADAEAVMDSWMNSEGHRANILNCDFTTLGTGAYMADGGPWWTQNFGY